MTSQTRATAEPDANPGWNVEQFARFWANPDPELVRHGVAPDVVADWPGDPQPVRGAAAYADRIAQVLERVPDIRLDVAEHATNGEFIFIRWIGRGTGASGPFELSGIDRIRVEQGLVKENIIRYDPGLFDTLVEGAPPSP
jgi:hypothetical protein